jgi:two-component sensor histidine kinase
MLVFLAVFAAILGYFLAIGINQTSERLVERSGAASQVVSINAGWITEVAHQALLRVDAALGPAVEDSSDELVPALEGMPALSEVYVIGPDARIFYSTVPSDKTVSVADREYFTSAQSGTQFYVSPLLVSRLTGERVFVFSKRIERAGAFAGVIVVSFPEGVLADLWHNLAFEDGSTIGLVRDDGQLMARYPPTDAPVDLSGVPLFTQYLPQSDVGSYSAASAIDGTERTVSYRRVPGTEIIAIASVASAQTWASFNHAVVAVLIIASPIVLGLVLGCAWIVMLLYRDAGQAKALETSLETNTMLFREIHHRVKNNLQSVQSLVRMQDMPRAAKLDLQSRFAAMAAMHEHIYQHDRYEDIDAHDFIPAVVQGVTAAYGCDAAVHYQVDHIAVDRDHATPLALLLSELVTNACKYAFTEADTGSVTISLVPVENGRARLTVHDNGPGIELDKIADRSMGMRLIKGVVAQMGGTYRFRNDGGAVFEADIALSTKVRNT